MPNNNLLLQVSPCGVHCADCLLLKAKDDEKAKEHLLKVGFKPEHIPCPGCREAAGKCAHLPQNCPNYACVTAKGHDFCFECDEFPCVKLHPAADGAATLPHNMKMYNLCTIKRVGIKEWLKMSGLIKKRYHMGKIMYGFGPRLPEDD